MNQQRQIDLYRLLPGVHRLRDAEHNYGLKALLEVINQEVDVISNNLDQLYENMFVETCQPWVVPYVGELVGIKRSGTSGPVGEPPSHHTRPHSLVSPRREVADAIQHYRRKGTISVLEELANVTADWPARAVEFYELVARARTISEFESPFSDEQPWGGTLDLRDADAIRRIDGPFDSSAHVVDLRALRANRLAGRYNIPHVGLQVWRLKSYPLTRTRAVCLPESCHGRCDDTIALFAFNPLGIPTPLFIKPEREAADTDIAQEKHVPAPLTLEAFRDSDHPTVPSRDYYGRDKSVEIWLQFGTKLNLLPREHVLPYDLSSLAKHLECRCQDVQSDSTAYEAVRMRLKGFFDQHAECVVAVDPETGLLAFASKPDIVEVTFHYGFSADVGGGEYQRPLRYSDRAKSVQTRLRCVGSTHDDAQHATEGDCDFVKQTRWSTHQLYLIREVLGPQQCSQLAFFDSLDDSRLFGNATPGEHVTLSIVGGTPSEEVAVSVDHQGYWSAPLRTTAPLLDGTIVALGSAQWVVHTAEGFVFSNRLANGSHTTTIEITDSSAYKLSQSKFFVDRGHTLEIRSTNGHRPLIRGVSEGCHAAVKFYLAPGSRVVLDGVALCGGKVEFADWNGLPPAVAGPADCEASDLSEAEAPLVTIRDCTINPPTGCACGKTALAIELTDALVTVEGSVLGRICNKKSQPPRTRLVVRDSIVDGQSGVALHGDGIRLKTERSTWFGSVSVDEIALAQDSIFTGTVAATRSQLGAMRFCYVSGSPQSPPRYYCQPDLSQQTRKPCSKINPTNRPCELDATVAASPARTVEPRFTSKCYGHPGYAQLALDCPDEIRRGAEDESEMGGFHELYQPQRTDNLQARLDAFQPVAMQAAIFFET